MPTTKVKKIGLTTLAKKHHGDMETLGFKMKGTVKLQSPLIRSIYWLVDACRREETNNWTTKHLEPSVVVDLDRLSGKKEFTELYRKRFGDSVEEAVCMSILMLMRLSQKSGFDLAIDATYPTEQIIGRLCKAANVDQDDFTAIMWVIIEEIGRMKNLPTPMLENSANIVVTYLYYLMDYHGVDLIQNLRWAIDRCTYEGYNFKSKKMSITY